jgi:hypothetical protein
MNTIEIERLRILVELSPDGTLKWKQGAQGRRMHKPAFSTQVGPGKNYLGGMADGVKLLAHRVVWALTYGEWPSGWVDHINGDTFDNRPENLRIAEPGLSNHNRRYADTAGGYIGVTFLKGKFVAQIQHNKKHHYLGRFESAEEAAKVRDAKAKELYGEDANLNFP